MPAMLDPEQMLSPAMIGGAVGLMSAPPPPLGTYPAFGMTMWFKVRVPGLDTGELGKWAKCSGLQVEFTSSEIKEGASYDAAPTLLPERLKYSKITLERAMSRESSGQVMAWLRTWRTNWMTPGGTFAAQTMTIELLDARQESVMTWDLDEAMPVGWKCSAFAAGNGAIAMETLELQHKGFL